MIGEIDTNWISPSDIASRIDAEYYQQHYVIAQSRLNTVHCVPFQTLWKDSYRIYMGIKGYDQVADPNSFTPYLRPVDIDEVGFINFNQLGWCEASWLKDYGQNGTAKPGDLIVEVKGNTRKVAILPSKIPENCVVSGSAWRIQISEEVDKHFIQAFLLSDSGQTLKRRQISNSIIPWIDPNAFKHLLIPQPDYEIQTHIGDKVRLAEKCRGEALLRIHALELMIDEVCDLCLLKQDIVHQTNHQYISVPMEVISNRLDAEFYRLEFSMLMEHILNRKDVFLPLRAIICSDNIQDGFSWASETFSNRGIPLIRIREIGNGKMNLENAVHISEDIALKHQKANLNSYEIVIGMDGSEFRAAMIHPFDGRAVVNQRVAMIQNLQPNIAALITFLINHYIGYQQLIRQKTMAAVVGHITKGDILNLVLPWQFENRTQAAKLALEAFEFSAWADRLVREAINDVEDLIENQLNTEGILQQTVNSLTWDDVLSQIANVK